VVVVNGVRWVGITGDLLTSCESSGVLELRIFKSRVISPLPITILVTLVNPDSLFRSGLVLAHTVGQIDNTRGFFAY
jgi:hypothetical protein